MLNRDEYVKKLKDQIDLDEGGHLCGLTLEHASARADLSGIDYQQIAA